MATKKPLQFKAPSSPPELSYTFAHGFAGGMNTSVNADAIAPSETPDVCNMELRNGIWSKRYGYVKLNGTSWGQSPIRGMFEFWQETEDGKTSTLLVAWNKKLWSVDEDGVKTDLCTGAKSEIADADVTFFAMGEKCYFLTGTEYCVYDGTNPVAEVTGYTPIIVGGKAPDGTGGYPGEEINILSNSWKEEFAGTVGDTIYVLSMAADSVVCEKDGVAIDPASYTFPTNGADYTKVTFDSAPGEGVISIQCTKDGLSDPSDITNCTIAQEWGGKNDTRVFFSGNPDISNRRWHSGLLDPTYFPVSAWTDIGSNAEAITGLGRLVDFQINYKERSMYYSSVEGPDAQGNVFFPALPMNEEYGCIAPRTVLPAQGGLLALAEEGVTFTVPSFVRGQLNVRLISKKINRSEWLDYGINDFALAQRRTAHAYIFDEKYYLHIGSKVWVLDLRHSNLPERVYCWYPFSGVPGSASCFLKKGGLLYVGDNAKGVVYKQLEGSYSDDGVGIDAWWASPMLFMDSRGWLKKFIRVKITFKAEQISDHIMIFITDMGSEDVLVRQLAGLFRYVNFSYEYWTYGVWNKGYPSIQVEKAGHKGEYFQFKIRNNTNRGMAIMGAIVDYQVKKEVR
jgi:hypothetical protein